MKKKNRVGKMTLMAAMVMLSVQTAYAGGITDSNLAVGTQRLFEDISKVLMILGPITAAAFAGYFVIRRGMADEQDAKVWQKRITASVICGVAVLLVGGLINLISSYYI